MQALVFYNNDLMKVCIISTGSTNVTDSMNSGYGAVKVNRRVETDDGCEVDVSTMNTSGIVGPQKQIVEKNCDSESKCMGMNNKYKRGTVNIERLDTNSATHNLEPDQRMKANHPELEQQNVEANSHEGVEVDVNNKTLSVKGGAKNTDASPIDSGAVKPKRVEAGGDDFEVEDLSTDVPHSDPTDTHSDPTDGPRSELTDGPTNVPRRDYSKYHYVNCGAKWCYLIRTNKSRQK